MEVYIVKRTYDEYVCGVFDTLENAEYYADQFKNEPVQIMQYGINSELDRLPPRMCAYECILCVITGKIKSITKLDPDEYDRLDSGYWNTNSDGAYFVCSLVSTKDEAANKASETLNKWKQNNPGWYTDIETALQERLRYNYEFYFEKLSQTYYYTQTRYVLKQINNLKNQGFDMDPVYHYVEELESKLEHK